MSDMPAPAAPYQVLARKYRPATFADLIGQEAMVRTLRNAFAADRIAHAFIMTGVRGVGKTTTARIIAKGLNCIGEGGAGGATIEPCGVCEPCVAIAAGRHVDVMEMDAASRTGVKDIREIIDSVNYRAASARYKVYIIDEIHMLSASAFNALLKTLEEPPAHVKFIFATTEIRKVPVTVLSRCQRFDLRRIEPEVLIAFLSGIAGREGVEIGDEALALIARAAEGSVRDALSLLDQAIAHGAGAATAGQVREMLGMADRGRVLDLFDLVMKGDAAGALEELSGQYAQGADPMVVLRDMAEVTHWISVVKISPQAAEDPTVTADERVRGSAMAQALSMRTLTRSWQMLLKALEEVAVAPNAMMAAEMAIIRLTHVADLPSPGDLVARLQSGLQSGPTSPQGQAPAAPRGGPGDGPPASASGGGSGHVSLASSGAGSGGATASGGGSGSATSSGGGGNAREAVAERPHAQRTDTAPVAMPEACAVYRAFDDVIALIRARRDIKLLIDVEEGLHLVKYAPGRIEFSVGDAAPRDLAARLAARLQDWTGVRWGVTVVNGPGAPTIAQTRAANRSDRLGQAMMHPMVQAVLAAFPGLGEDRIRVLDPAPAPETNEDVVPLDPDDVDDEWSPVDPFA